MFDRPLLLARSGGLLDFNVEPFEYLAREKRGQVKSVIVAITTEFRDKIAC